MYERTPICDLILDLKSIVQYSKYEHKCSSGAGEPSEQQIDMLVTGTKAG